MRVNTPALLSRGSSMLDTGKAPDVHIEGGE